MSGIWRISIKQRLEERKNGWFLLVFFAIFLPFAQAIIAADDYSWLPENESTPTLRSIIDPPQGFERLPFDPASFASWLRNFPMKPDTPPVRLFDGTLKYNQDAHFAVMNIDTGHRDLQQCADAVIRLRSEYLFARQAYDDIAFRFTNGTLVPYKRWQRGERPKVRGNKVTWAAGHTAGNSYVEFRKYLTTLFIYAGTLSLARDLVPVHSISDMQIGDVFLQSGSPGHAVLVVDMAEQPHTGKRVFLVAQSYMPAQDIHILVNPNDRTLSPWYAIEPEKKLVTPEWTFAPGKLFRFSQASSE